MKFQTLLFSILFLFTIGYSAEAPGTSVILSMPSNTSTIDIVPQTSIPFTFKFTSSVTNASCILYLKSNTYNQTPYGNNCTVYNNTLTTIYANHSITNKLYADEIEWIVNCSIGCNDWSTWKDADDWFKFTYDHETIQRDLTETGLGVGALFDSIKEPLFGFILLLGLGSGTLFIWKSISKFIKKAIK